MRWEQVRNQRQRFGNYSSFSFPSGFCLTCGRLRSSRSLSLLFWHEKGVHVNKWETYNHETYSIFLPVVVQDFNSSVINSRFLEISTKKIPTCGEQSRYQWLNEWVSGPVSEGWREPCNKEKLLSQTDVWYWDQVCFVEIQLVMSSRYMKIFPILYSSKYSSSQLGEFFFQTRFFVL